MSNDWRLLHHAEADIRSKCTGQCSFMLSIVLCLNCLRMTQLQQYGAPDAGIHGYHPHAQRMHRAWFRHGEICQACATSAVTVCTSSCLILHA